MLHLSTLILAAALGQAPAESAWLDVVPAEADVVVRVSGVEAARKDLVAMIKAMSPALGAQAEPAIEQGVAGFRAQMGEHAATDPFMTIIRGVAPENNAPPFAVVVKSPNYEAVLKSVSGGNAPKLKHEEGGYDSFDGQQGQTWYGAKKGDFVAFGPDKTLVASFAKGSEKSLGKSLSPVQKKQFVSGDVSIYVNAGSLTTRYADAIAQGKQGLMAALDQAGQQPQMAGMMEMVKKMYGGMFDSAKDADGLTLSLDFSAEGLGVNGELTVKADSDGAKTIAGSKGSNAAGLAKMPAGASYYVYMSFDAALFEKLQRLALGMMTPGGKPTPEVDAALAKQRVLGRMEAFSSATMDGGMTALHVYTSTDPKALFASTEAALKAISASDSPLNIFKDVKITANAEDYKGFKFTRVEMVVDVDKLAKMQPGNPNAAASVKAMYGGDRITSWYGVSDTQMIQVTDANWDKAKAQIDAFLSGDRAVAASPGFTAVRAKLPEQVNVMMLLSAQGFIKQITTQLGAAMGNPDLKAATDLPKEPAIIGAALSLNAPTGFEFHLVIPSSVGPVVEKGIAPLMPRGQ